MLKYQPFKTWIITLSIILCNILIFYVSIEAKADSGSVVPPLPKLPELSQKDPLQNSSNNRQPTKEVTEVIQSSLPALPVPINSQQSSTNNVPNAAPGGGSSDSLNFDNNDFNADELFKEFAEDAEKEDAEKEDAEKEDTEKKDTEKKDTEKKDTEKNTQGLSEDNATKSLNTTDPTVVSVPLKLNKEPSISVNESTSVTAPKDTNLLSLPDIPDASEVDQSKINSTKLPQQIAKEKNIKERLKTSSALTITQEDLEKINNQSQAQDSNFDPYNIQISKANQNNDADKQDADKKNLSLEEKINRDSFRKKRNTTKPDLVNANKNTSSTISQNSLSQTTSVNKSTLAENNNKTSGAGSSYSLGTNAIDSKQATFITNEAQVLLLANDDVVLGKLTEEAELEGIEFDSYMVLFQKHYKSPEDIKKHDKLVDFINRYGEIFYPEETFHSNEDDQGAFSVAIEAITRNKFMDLKALLDNYSILQLKDSGHNNLLHAALIVDNYAAARLLLMRGIDMRTINNMGYNSIEIARKLNNSDMIFLLNSAGF